jgi:hypothetical protein
MKRPENAGRRKGQQPKKLTVLSRDVATRLEELGCDPIEGLVKIANNKKADFGTRAKCFADLANFVYAKRKSVEHTGLGDTVNIYVGAAQSFTDRVAGIRARLGIKPADPVGRPGDTDGDAVRLAQMERAPESTSSR